jgi:hypothetical protein
VVETYVREVRLDDKVLEEVRLDGKVLGDPDADIDDRALAKEGVEVVGTTGGVLELWHARI